MKALLEQLESVCRQAQELQATIKLQMAEAARRDYPAQSLTERRKAVRKKR